jgi:hypothetical protein
VAKWTGPVLKAADAIDRWIGGNVKYALGKRYLRQGRLSAALVAFTEAEELLIREKGVDHQHVVAAIIRQAECQARMGNRTDACREYRRALVRMTEIGDGEHPTAKAISKYIASACP